MYTSAMQMFTFLLRLVGRGKKMRFFFLAVFMVIASENHTTYVPPRNFGTRTIGYEKKQSNKGGFVVRVRVQLSLFFVLSRKSWEYIVAVVHGEQND